MGGTRTGRFGISVSALLLGDMLAVAIINLNDDYIYDIKNIPVEGKVSDNHAAH
jgi:hypothetical protein